MKKRNSRLSVIFIALIALFFVSVGLAQREEPKAQEGKIMTADPASIMQILMLPAGSPVDRCLLPQKEPIPEECRPFFSVDDALEMIIQK